MYKPTGIIHLTGEPDTGKTLAALGAYRLKDTAYIYDDVKKFNLEGMNSKEMKDQFGLFIDLTEKYPNSKYKEMEFAKAVMDELDQIEYGKYQSIVLDTWTRFGKALRRYAKINPQLFREKEAFTQQTAIKNAEEWGQAGTVEKDYISLLSRKSEALFLITHIKKQRKGQIELETYEPDCGKVFYTVCNARFWFRTNSNSGVPIILVPKRLSKVPLHDSGYIQPINMLPRKITPRENEQSVWDCIERYNLDPIGNRLPAEDEIPTPFEISILDGILTDDQKEFWRAEQKARERQNKEDQELFSNEWAEAQTYAKQLASLHNGMPPSFVVDEIWSEFESKYGQFSKEDLEKML